MSRPKPLALIILDGWGLREEETGNAICQAQTPYFDFLAAAYPSATILASGDEVLVWKWQNVSRRKKLLFMLF